MVWKSPSMMLAMVGMSFEVDDALADGKGERQGGQTALAASAGLV